MGTDQVVTMDETDEEIQPRQMDTVTVYYQPALGQSYMYSFNRKLFYRQAGRPPVITEQEGSVSSGNPIQR